MKSFFMLFLHAIFAWYQEVYTRKGHVSGPIFQQKALDFLPTLGMMNFKQLCAGGTSFSCVRELFQKLY